MRFHHRVTVRFRDLDAMGHVHHGEPLLYLEEARAAYWREVAGRATVADIDYVMGEVTVRFHRRITYPDTLDVALRVSRLGGVDEHGVDPALGQVQAQRGPHDARADHDDVGHQVAG